MYYDTKYSPTKNLKPLNFAKGRTFAPKIILGVQGPNQEFEGEIEEGNQEAKEAKEARSTSDIGQSLFGLA